MLKLPGKMTAERFLTDHWQKSPLLMPQAMTRVHPAVTRNELAWLATLDDVESRIVFTDRNGDQVRYRAESGPFDDAFLGSLPARDWTLLVHDVEKHLPAMRRLFEQVPFIPDWRIDDLMVSFAAPGGGVGPHRDNYDVFLCQGIGIRDWHVTTLDVGDDPRASNELSLTKEFAGDLHTECRNGDVLYLPPGIAHWGTAQRACITYSIGMRAPQYSDLVDELPDQEGSNPFYTDPDLHPDEAVPGLISDQAIRRVIEMGAYRFATQPAITLGHFATANKQWITPDKPDDDDIGTLLEYLIAGRTLQVHGMAQLAWSDMFAFVNGSCEPLRGDIFKTITMKTLCRDRSLQLPGKRTDDEAEWIRWIARYGAFEIPERP